MTTTRLNAFFDAVTAIIITIMVLDLTPPNGESFSDLSQIISNFLVYILSFLFIAVYWNNHHHIMSIIKKVNAKFLWINILILFLISLIPFTTSWVAATDFAPDPVALYGIISLAIALSMSYLVHNVEQATFGKNSILLKRERTREKASIIIQVIAIIIALVFNYSFLTFAILIINLFIIRNPPKVIEVYHDLVEEGIDIDNDEKAQFSALFTQEEKERFIKRYTKRVSDQAEIDQITLLIDNNDVQGLAEYKIEKDIRPNRKNRYLKKKE